MAMVDLDWVEWRNKMPALNLLFEKHPNIADIARLAFLSGKVAGRAQCRTATEEKTSTNRRHAQRHGKGNG